MTVSPANVQDPRSGEDYYVVRLRIPPEALRNLKDKSLLPGMPVEVFMQTTARTPLSIVTRPLREVMQRAFREG